MAQWSPLTTTVICLDLDNARLSDKRSFIDKYQLDATYLGSNRPSQLMCFLNLRIELRGHVAKSAAAPSGEVVVLRGKNWHAFDRATQAHPGVLWAEWNPRGKLLQHCQFALDRGVPEQGIVERCVTLFLGQPAHAVIILNPTRCSANDSLAEVIEMVELSLRTQVLRFVYPGLRVQTKQLWDVDR